MSHSMSHSLLFSALGALCLSMSAWAGGLLQWTPQRFRDTLLTGLTSLAAGFLLGNALLHLLPEAWELQLAHGAGGPLMVRRLMAWVLIGITLFFGLEKLIRHHHHGTRLAPGSTGPMTVAKLNLLGNGIHRFVDGIVLASSFMLSPLAGVITTLAILAHEIPQKISDTSVLIKGGYSLMQAVRTNFLTSQASLVGAVVTCWLGASLGNSLSFMTPLAAGGLIYLALAGMVPQLHGQPTLARSQLLFLIAGMGVMGWLAGLE